MKNTIESEEEIVRVPADMMMDIFSILVKEGLKHEVIEVLHNRSLVIIAISYNKNMGRQQKAISNIQNILTDYQHYRSWENEEFNWRA